MRSPLCCFLIPWIALLSIDLAPAETPLFSPLSAEQSGIDFVNPIDTEHPLERIYLGAFACGGVAIGDLDGDGVHDLFLTSGPRPNRLYRGLGDLKFDDVTEAKGMAAKDDRWAAGATLVDIDADGDLDIHVCYYDSPNELWVNDGEGKFVERAADFGLAISDASLMASFCDYDRDGDLDCFVLTRDFKRAGGRPQKHPIEKDENGQWRIMPGFEKYYMLKPKPGGGLAYINAGREDFLLRNDGGTFTDVSKAAGISGRDRGNSAAWWDFDGDGLPDLYVGNDFKDADRLYRNNGDGTFTDVIKQVASHTPWFSMGSDVADLDGDGQLDFLIADMAGTNHYRSKTTMGEITSIRPFLTSAVPRQYMHNALYLNNGTSILTDASHLAGLASSDWCWAVKCADFDLDGRTDVFFTNGVSRSFNDSDDQRAAADYIGQEEWDYYEPKPPRKEQNLVFRNKGGLDFEDVSKAWGLDHLGMSYAAATGDLDGDGDLEIVTANLDEPVRIYRNNAKGNWIKIRLQGSAGNRYGLGVRVEVDGQVQVLQPATGFLSCNAPELVFGLGEAEVARNTTVHWSTGHVTHAENLAAGGLHVMIEPPRLPAKPTTPKKDLPSYASINSPSLRAIAHTETPYDDYARQPLLPYQHSTLGPGLAWADVDADGDADFYLSAPAGQAARIGRNDGRATFTESSAAAFAADTASEDLGAVFFDADGDGDPDLYVVSGGVECEPGAKSLRDRLYLNDGTGNFTKAEPAALPDRRDSGSCVVAADYDRDGDIDVFVGGRVVPGAYPEEPRSCLLQNDGAGSFSVAGLEKVGLVTAALWSDADGDGWLDLLVCCEWGPVKLFQNKAGTLGAAKPLTANGWWNGIAGADLDGDGDIDYIATNRGLNTPYKATKDKPELLYYGDFDGSGRRHIVEAKHEGDTLFPRRGLSCSSGAMPVLREKLKTFHNYATSSLADLYTAPKLDTSLRVEAHQLASVALINDGDGTFSSKPLPTPAQMSPGNGIALSDFDADGHVDAVIGQNFYGAQPEIGWHDAGLSVLLRGHGDGTFTAVPPAESGLMIRPAAMAVTLCDLNADARPELAFATNSGGVYIFGEPGAARAENRMLQIRLAGAPSNPTAIGARVTVTISDISQTAEITAGSGYLGQSDAALWFGVGSPADDDLAMVTVRWPDGELSRPKPARRRSRDHRPAVIARAVVSFFGHFIAESVLPVRSDSGYVWRKPTHNPQ